MKTRIFSAFAASFLLASCAAPRIQYPLVLENRRNPDLGIFAIAIDSFVDLRAESSPHREEIFEQEEADYQRECFNKEKNYDKPPPIRQMQIAFGKHLKSKGLFKSVTLPVQPGTDLRLRLEVSSFAISAELNQEARSAQMSGASFGLVGAALSAIATSSMTSKSEYEIAYRNIRVIDKAGKELYRIPEFVSREPETDIAAVTDCRQVYELLNNRLKIHNERLIEKLVNELPAKLRVN